MSETKKTPEKWKSEQSRAQRKARLAQMKSKEGGKKPIRTTNPAARLVVVLVLVIALIITGVWTAVRLGVPQRSLTALTVGSEKIHAIELNYYYYSLLKNYNLDPANAENQATLKAASGIEGFKTNADYLKDQAAQQVQQNVMLSDQAVKTGLALDASEKTQIDTYFTSLVSAAATANLTYSNFLITSFGAGCTEKALRPVMERMVLASKYAIQKEASFTFADSDVQTAYEADKDAYDVVNYRVFLVKTESKTDATDAEKTKAQEAARTIANEILGKITDGLSFRDLCIEYTKDAAEKKKYQDDDLSLSEGAHKGNVSVTAQSTWLFDATRKAGDKAVLDAPTGFYIMYFESRQRPENKLVDVRHILITAGRETATAEEITTAKTKAEAVLAEYEAGARTEDSFAELAKTNSADGNASAGGIYKAIKPGQMVAEFDSWIFDPARKTGDTGIVQTDFGFHVMYFVGQADSDWQANVKTTLRTKAFSDYLVETAKSYAYKMNSFGLRFVG